MIDDDLDAFQDLVGSRRASEKTASALIEQIGAAVETQSAGQQEREIDGVRRAARTRLAAQRPRLVGGTDVEKPTERE